MKHMQSLQEYLNVFFRAKKVASPEIFRTVKTFFCHCPRPQNIFTGTVLCPTADASPVGVETVFSSAFALPRLTDNARPARAQRIHHALLLHCLHS